MGRTTQEMEEILQQIQAGVARIERDHGARFEALEGKFDALEGKFGALEGKFGALEGKFGALEGKFDALGGKVDSLEGKIDAVHADLVRIENDHGTKIEALFDGFDLVNGRLDSVDGRLDSVEGRLDRLEGGQDEMRMTLRQINGTLGLLHPIASDHESRIQALESVSKK